MTKKSNTTAEPLNAQVMQQQVEALDQLCQEVVEIQNAGFSPCETLKKLKPKIDQILSLVSTLSYLIPALKTLPTALTALLAIGDAFCSGAATGAGGGGTSGELS